jgi:ParB-like chromosome segregation protein Spo0J
VAKSIETWGFTIPVLRNEEGFIIAGHCRVLAAASLGIESIPTMTAKGWSEEQQRAYIIADNRLTELGSWDKDVLRDEVIFLDSQDFDLPAIGYDEVQIGSFLNGLDDDLFALTKDGEGSVPKPDEDFEPTKTQDGYTSFAMVLPVDIRNMINRKIKAHMTAHGITERAVAFAAMMETHDG